MLKRDELAHPGSCINNAADDEMVFVLRGKDPAFAATVRAWAEIRIVIGKNRREDLKIQSALADAARVEGGEGGGK